MLNATPNPSLHLTFASRLRCFRPQVSANVRGRVVPRLWAIVIASFLGSDVSHSAERCGASAGIEDLVSDAALPVSPETIQALRPDMTLGQVIERLGPASRDIGSGLHILEWRVTDGRSYRVSGASLCERPMQATFVHDAPTNKSLELTRGR
jgi:hypothetical protein